MGFLKKSSRQEILITLEVIEFIETESALAINTETGGVIGGKGKVEEGNVIITKASDGGQKAIKRHSFFSRDTKYAQFVVDDWARHSNGEIDYLGEWHKHLEPVPHPSFRDIDTMKNIALQNDYHVSQPILIIIGESSSRKSLRLYIVNQNGEMTLVSWKLHN